LLSREGTTHFFFGVRTLSHPQTPKIALIRAPPPATCFSAISARFTGPCFRIELGARHVRLVTHNARPSAWSRCRFWNGIAFFACHSTRRISWRALARRSRRGSRTPALPAQGPGELRLDCARCMCPRAPARRPERSSPNASGRSGRTTREATPP